MPVSECSLDAGVRLGPYEIVSFIAAGGTGEVYEARDTRLNRGVAIKVLSAAYGGDRERLLRFEKEARSASQLAHPNIITIYDIGDQGELSYVVTELLEGRALSTILDERRLAIDEVTDIAIQMARGLAAAHEKRIVHRGLEPANIFITTAGHVKILNFGLARLAQDEWQAATTEETQSLISRPEAIVGRAGYLSPEQVQGAAADLRSDIFSFGSVLYEMLTGRAAFMANSAVDTMTAIVRDEPAPLDPAERPADLIAIVNRCLSKRPGGRFASASELLFAMQQTAAAGASGSARASSGIRSAMERRPTARLAAAVAVIAVVTLLFSGVPRTRAAGGTSRNFSVPVVTVERLTSDGGAHDAVVSADGGFMAYLQGQYPTGRPRLRHIGSGSDLQLIPPREGVLFDPRGFSPDGSYVYLQEYVLTGLGHRDSPLYSPLALVRVPLLGGTPEAVVTGRVSKIRLAPDGNSLAFVRWSEDDARTELVCADPLLKNQRVIAEVAGGALWREPAWSADSKHLLIVAPDAGPNATLQPTEFDVATGASRKIAFCNAISLSGDIESAPGGGWIVQSDQDQLWHVSAEGTRCVQLTDDTRRWQLGSATADRSTIVALGTQEVQNLWRVTLGDRQPSERLTQGINTEDGSNGIALLADGRVVFPRNATGRVTGRKHLWMLDLAGNMRQLTDGNSEDGEPVAAAVGTSIVYRALETDANHNIHSHLTLLNVDSGESRRLASGQFLRNASFSPDGTFVYYMEGGGRPRAAVLERVSVSAGPSEDVTPPGAKCAFIRVSPDTRMISCLASNGLLSVISMDGNKVVRSLTLPRISSSIRWLPDSSSVTFLRRLGNESTEIWLVPLPAGEPHPIAHLSGSDQFGDSYTWARDARSFVCTRAAEASDAFLIRLQSTTSPR